MNENNLNNVLPADFDGVFRFTNFTENEFKARWDGIEYTFPALKTTPMIIPNSTPEQVQHIRKKFARELAEKEFYKTEKFKGMNDVPPGGTPALYTDSDLTPFIQRCLEPLPLAQAAIKVVKKDTAENYRKDNRGKNITRPLDKDESLLSSGGGDLE
jgi:hypothetical protein